MFEWCVESAGRCYKRVSTTALLTFMVIKGLEKSQMRDLLKF